MDSSTDHQGRPSFLPPAPVPSYFPPPDAIPPSDTPPSGPPPRGGSSAALIAVIVVLAVALLLGGWFVVRPRLAGSPATQPTSPTRPATSPQSSPATPTESVALAWSAPLPLGPIGGTYPIAFDSGVDGIVLVQAALGVGYTYSTSVEAIDVNSMTVLWAITDVEMWAGAQVVGTAVPVGVDSAGVLLEQVVPPANPNGDPVFPGYELIDPRTGALLWQASRPGTTVISFGDGFIVTQNGADSTICARRIASPETCVWQAPGVKTPGGWGYLITGGGAWLQTPKGVLDMATGAAAPFGADTYANYDTWGEVAYTGPSKDRILRVEYLDGGARATIQMWNTVADAPMGQPASRAYAGPWPVITDQEAPVYVEASGGPLTAYSWDGGRQQWQVSDPLASPGWGSTAAGEIAGNTLLWASYYSSSGAPAMAFDLTDGHILWRDDTLGLMPSTNYGSRSSVIGNVCYLHGGSYLYALSLEDFSIVGTIQLPVGLETSPGQTTSFLGVASGRVMAISPGGQLYVLQS